MPGDTKKRFYSSIFFTILCINLFSILVLSIFNYYVFHRLSGKAYLESFLSNNQRVTELAFRNIDNQIMMPVLKIAQLYFSPINENAPLLAPQEENISGSPKKVLELITEMRKIQKTYPYITNIDIYYEGTQTVLTGFDKVHFPADAARIGQYLPWYGQYLSGTLREGFNISSGGVYLIEEPVITYMKKISMPKWGDKHIVLAVSVNPRGFTDYIDQQGGELSILTMKNQLLYDSTGMEAGARKLAAFHSAAGGEDNLESSGYSEVRFGEWNMTVFYFVSLVSGLTYLYSVDTASFYENYNLTSRMFLINFFISILFNLIVLGTISYYNYAAYRRRVLTLSKKAGIAMNTADKSFDGSLTQLTKEITDLHAAVQSSKGTVLQNAVRSVLLKHGSGDAFAELASYLSGDSVCVYILSLSEQAMEQLSVDALQEGFSLEQDGYHVLFTTVERDSLVALQSFDNGDYKAASQAFIRRIDAYWKNCPVVSGIVCFLKEDGIKSSYKSAVETERYRYIIPQERFLSYEKVNIGKRKASGSHIKLFEAMKKDVNNEDLLEWKLHVEMLVEAFKTGAYTIEYCTSTLRDLVTLFYQIMQQNQLDMWIVFGYDIREYYKKIPNIDVFHGWCESLCEMILKNIHQKKASVDTDISARVLRLVDENLEKNISLDFLADQLHIRPDTASRTFRQIMGTGYSEYIKTRKLSRALELIEAGSSVKEVADRLGYSTPQYFIKVFKESYGVTPLQYKKKMEQEKLER